MKNKVAFIGPEAIHDAFSKIDENWNFQSPITTLDEFQTEINSDEENSKVDSDTSVIILFSRLFEGENQKQFAQLAAFLSPYSAVCILYPEVDGEDQKDLIRYQIKAEQTNLANNDPDLENIEDSPFYFIPYENPQAGLSEALALYVRDPYSDPSARQAILASMPDNVARTLQAENDEAEVDFSDEDVIIPERSETATGRVITVTSSKGGSGKSTISMLLGAYIAKGSKLAYEQGTAEKPLKVCIVDLDVRDGQLGFMNGVQSPTVVDIVASGSLTPESINNGVYHSNKMDCDFIFAAKRPRYTAAIPPEFYAGLIQILREMYDYIILDTSVNYLDPLLESVAYPMSEKIIFVTDLSISSIFGMARWIQETTRVEDTKDPIDPEKIGIVVNKVLKNVNMDIEKVKSASGGRPILTMYPSAPGLITYAANTCSLEQVLNQKSMNTMAKRLADSIVEPTGFKLAELPSVD